MELANWLTENLQLQFHDFTCLRAKNSGYCLQQQKTLQSEKNIHYVGYLRTYRRHGLCLSVTELTGHYCSGNDCELLIDAGKISQTMPASGISNQPATVETAFAAMVAIAARFAGRAKSQRMKKNSTTRPIAIAHHEKRRTSR